MDKLPPELQTHILKDAGRGYYSVNKVFNEIHKYYHKPTSVDLIRAVTNINEEAVKYILDYGELINIDDGFERAVLGHNVDILRLFLEDVRISQETLNKWFIFVASEHEIKIFKAFLESPRVDVNYDKGAALMKIVDKGRISFLKLLLLDNRTNVGINKNQALNLAIFNWNDIIFDMLRTDPRVNPADNDNLAIRTAAYTGNSYIMQRLLQDSRVDPAARDNEPFHTALEMRREEVALQLLADPRVNPWTRGDGILKEAEKMPQVFKVLSIDNRR